MDENNESKMFSAEDIPILYDSLLDGIDDLKAAGRSKGLAKLGDEIINMVYSLAYSLKFSKPTGEKVNQTVLSEAMRKTGLRSYAKPRANSHDIADSAEAIIAYYFLLRKATILEMVSFVLNGFSQTTSIPRLTIEKRELDISGLIALLGHIAAEFKVNCCS